jgi:hypothetical protein
MKKFLIPACLCAGLILGFWLTTEPEPPYDPLLRTTEQLMEDAKNL